MLKGVQLKPVTRDQITMLFSYLIGAPGLRSGPPRDRVDALLMAWLHNPSSYGTHPVPHANVQRRSYMQRIMDLLVSGDLSVTDDREHLKRFLQWVDNWEAEWKSRLLSIFDFLRRDYPAADLWDIVEFP